MKEVENVKAVWEVKAVEELTPSSVQAEERFPYVLVWATLGALLAIPLSIWHRDRELEALRKCFKSSVPSVHRPFERPTIRSARVLHNGSRPLRICNIKKLTLPHPYPGLDEDLSIFFVKQTKTNLFSLSNHVPVSEKPKK